MCPGFHRNKAMAMKCLPHGHSRQQPSTLREDQTEDVSLQSGNREDSSKLKVFVDDNSNMARYQILTR